MYTGSTIPSLNRKTELNPDFFEIISKINVLLQRIELIYTNSINNYNIDKFSGDELELGGVAN